MIGRFICYPTCGERPTTIEVDKASRIEIAGWLRIFSSHTNCRCCSPLFKGDDGIEATVAEDGSVQWYRLNHDYSTTNITSPRVCC